MQFEIVDVFTSIEGKKNNNQNISISWSTVQWKYLAVGKRFTEIVSAYGEQKHVYIVGNILSSK